MQERQPGPPVRPPPSNVRLTVRVNASVEVGRLPAVFQSKFIRGSEDSYLQRRSKFIAFYNADRNSLFFTTQIEIHCFFLQRRSKFFYADQNSFTQIKILFTQIEILLRRSKFFYADRNCFYTDRNSFTQIEILLRRSKQGFRLLIRDHSDQQIWSKRRSDFGDRLDYMTLYNEQLEAFVSNLMHRPNRY